MKTYNVTITPKFPTWNNKAWTMQVFAKSSSDANKTARRELQNEGHHFTQSDAVTFKSTVSN